MVNFIAVAASLLVGLLLGAFGVWLRLSRVLRSVEREREGQKMKMEQLGQRLHEQGHAFQKQVESLERLQIAYAEARETLAVQKAHLSRLEQLEKQEHELREQLSIESCEKAELKTALEKEKIAFEKEQQHHNEKLQQLEQSRKEMSQQFENLANRILEEKSKNFQEQNRTSLEHLINPLKNDINSFRAKVEQTYDRENQDRVRLRTQIEALTKSNQTISTEATNLAQALKGQNQAQGAWGEMILERVLEASGLENGREYSTQFSAMDEEGRRLRPDVIVHLPSESGLERNIIVDAKVSLLAYDRYQNAPTESERTQALKEHWQSLQNHIKTLSEKKYQNLPAVPTLDYVLLFVPIEGAYSLAVQHYPELTQQALTRNIVIVTPTTLLLALRTVENIWSYERQNRNAVAIAKEAGALYDKFVGFTDDLLKVQKSLTQAQETADGALNKLSEGRGNVVNRIKKLKKMSGFKTQKSIAATIQEKADQNAEEEQTLLPQS